MNFKIKKYKKLALKILIFKNPHKKSIKEQVKIEDVRVREVPWKPRRFMEKLDLCKQFRLFFLNTSMKIENLRRGHVCN